MKFPTRQSRFFLLLKLSVTAVAMLILIRAVHVREILGALRNPARPDCLAAAAILLVPNLLLQWIRWHLLLRLINPHTPVSDSVASLFGGMVAGFVTPGRIGEIGRTLFLKHEDRLQAVGLIVIDKLYAFFPVAAAGFWGLVLLLSYQYGYAPFLVWPLFFGAVVFMALSLTVILHPEWIRSFLYYLSMLMPAREKLKRIISCIDRFSRPDALLQAGLASLLYAVYILQFCLLAFAFQPVPWTTALTATTSVILVKTILPVSIGDLGIREGASVYFFTRFNVEQATAFNASLLLFVLNVLIPTILGLIFIPRMGWPERKDMKRHK
ncbi:flippase-like domain-containing protein [bacterium]|nr:flippase-like domain-containing protein [bacterium]